MDGILPISLLRSRGFVWPPRSGQYLMYVAQLFPAERLSIPERRRLAASSQMETKSGLKRRLVEHCGYM